MQERLGLCEMSPIFHTCDHSSTLFSKQYFRGSGRGNIQVIKLMARLNTHWTAFTVIKWGIPVVPQSFFSASSLTDLHGQMTSQLVFLNVTAFINKNESNYHFFSAHDVPEILSLLFLSLLTSLLGRVKIITKH